MNEILIKKKQLCLERYWLTSTNYCNNNLCTCPLCSCCSDLCLYAVNSLCLIISFLVYIMMENYSLSGQMFEVLQVMTVWAHHTIFCKLFYSCFLSAEFTNYKISFFGFDKNFSLPVLSNQSSCQELKKTDSGPSKIKAKICR